MKITNLRIGLVSDELTAKCLSQECEVIQLTPFNYRFAITLWKPDFIFVESAWHGHWNSWKYKVATHPRREVNRTRSLRNLIGYAKERGIPAVFWNKEDGVHFDRFIDSAKLFDNVYTVDERCIPMYKIRLGPKAKVKILSFPVQTKFHNFTGFNFKSNNANFVGSYSSKIHSGRRNWQDMMFNTCSVLRIPLSIYDRNWRKLSANYRYPAQSGIQVNSAIPHEFTGSIYKSNLISLNVNTVDDSRSMYSRRLVEILACGGVAVTNPSLSVSALFEDFCYAVSEEKEAADLLSRLAAGPTHVDLERAAAGADYVKRHHNWTARLLEICSDLGIPTHR